MGSTLAEVCTSGRRTSRLGSTPARVSRSTSTSPRASEPMAPALRTSAPSLARVRAVPPAGPAAVSLIALLEGPVPAGSDGVDEVLGLARVERARSADGGGTPVQLAGPFE